MGGNTGLELVCDVPGDRFTLAIGVSGQVNSRGAFGRLLEIREGFRFPLDRDVFRLEPVLDIYAKLARR
jgi:hypothetical protein